VREQASITGCSVGVELERSIYFFSCDATNVIMAAQGGEASIDMIASVSRCLEWSGRSNVRVKVWLKVSSWPPFKPEAAA
jgi:hypothetical protein